MATVAAPNGHAKKVTDPTASIQYQGDKANTKKANLALVPCKFWKAGNCSAGPACPFAHSEPGQPKSVCPWFLQGPMACKFGSKCMLAHVLPGQPMGMDRKNKRAQQLAQREADANGTNSAGGSPPASSPPSSAPTAPPKTPTSPSSSPDKARRRQPSSGIARALEAASKNGTNIMTGFVPPPTQPSVGTSNATGVPRNNQPAWTTSLPPAVKGEPTPSPDSAPSRQFGFTASDESNGRSALADQSTPSTVTPHSPFHSIAPLQEPPQPVDPFTQANGLSLAHQSFSFANSPPRSSLLSRSPSSTAATAQVLGTSPFSFPGTKSIFLSPTAGDHQMGQSLVDQRSASVHHTNTRRFADLQLLEREEEDDGAEEFLPSSLHDLLTDSELRRHRSRQAGDTLLSQHEMQSRSVPAQGFLEARYGQRESRRDLWLHEQHSAQNEWPSGLPAKDQYLTDPLLSPTQDQSLLNHPPGTSLPPGLAAGMSRLHFTPAAYTGETPSSSFVPPTTHAYSPRSPWQRPNGFSTGAGAPEGQRSALGRRLSSGANGLHHVGSPLSQTWTGEHNEAPYSPWQAKPTPTATTPRKSALAELNQEEDDLPFSFEA